MITWVRSAEINHGKRTAAMEWALRASAYVNETFGTNLTVQVNVAGPVSALHWVATYDSLAEFEDVSMRVVADEGYLQLVAESTEQHLYDTHSFNDALYRSIG